MPVPDNDFPTPDGLQDVMDDTQINPEDAFKMPSGLEEPEAVVVPEVQQPKEQPKEEPQKPVEAPKEPPKETSTDDLGYDGIEIDDAFKPLVDVFKEYKVKYSDVELVMGDAIKEADSSKINLDVLNSLVNNPAIAGMIASTLDGIILKAKTGAQQKVQELYNLAGGEAQYKAALAYAKEQGEQAILNGIASDNQTLQQFAVEKMMSIFKANNVQAPSLVDAKPQGTPKPQADYEPLTQREYAEELQKLRNEGKWDGASYHHPTVKKLVQRLQATARAEADRTEAARRAADAAMEAYYKS